MTISLPAGSYNLTQTGTEDASARVNDLDIHTEVTIAGHGAGRSVVNGGGALGLGDRIFQVHAGGSLSLSQLTVTGGSTATGEAGGGISILADGVLSLDEVAVASNSAGGVGGRIASTGNLTVTDSVVALNHATDGGGVHSAGGESSYQSTLIANNTATSSTYNDINITDGTSQGDNLLTSAPGTAFVNGANGDLVQSGVDYVVTTIADAINAADDARVLSLREAVLKANATAGAETIWLPAWHFDLSVNDSDSVDEAFAQEDDLDVLDSLEVVGVGAGLTDIEITYDRDYPPEAADEVFSLHPFHPGHEISLTLSRLSTANELSAVVNVPGVTAPTNAPAIPDNLKPPKLPFVSGGVESPQIAELNHTAGADESITITGDKLRSEAATPSVAIPPYWYTANQPMERWCLPRRPSFASTEKT